jgi:glycosyltransferase involved in cell wall biosynthesis
MKRETPRIVVVTANTGFFVGHYLRVAIAGRERGYDIHAATPPGKAREVIEAAGIPWHSILLDRQVTAWHDARSIFDLSRTYRRLAPDIAHHIAIKPVVFGTIAARMAKVPAVVNTFAGLGYAFDEDRSKTLLGRSVALAVRTALRHRRVRATFENPENRDLFLQRGWIASRDAVLLPGAGIDVDAFTPSESPRETPPLVVLASRLLYSKGVVDFVDAARIVRARGSNARFVIIGSPDDASPDRVDARLLDQWKAEGVIELWGQRSDMPDILRRASVFCLPTYYREGIPKAIMEAAACGLPSVTTDTAGCRDFVIDGETGKLVPPRNVEELANALQWMLDHPAQAEEMGRRARRRVVEHFSIAHVIDATLSIYDDLLRCSDS